MPLACRARNILQHLRTGLVSMTRRAPGLFSGGTRSLMGLYVGQRTDLEPAAARYRDRAI